jgi:hypothetical protein
MPLITINPTRTAAMRNPGRVHGDGGPAKSGWGAVERGIEVPPGGNRSGQCVHELGADAEQHTPGEPPAQRGRVGVVSDADSSRAVSAVRAV